MSEGDSPHGALSDSETNNSIIHKVRTRVSSIIPNSFSKWFSPSSKGDGKNGSNRRRREISEEQDSSNEESYNQEEENGSEPPVKRTKCDLLEESSTSQLEDPFLPSTSQIHNRGTSTHSKIETRTSTSSNVKKLASTPSATSLLNRHRRHLGLNKTVSSTPYDFNAKSLSNFEVTQHNNYSNNNMDTSHYSRGLDVRKRMKLDSIGGRSSYNTTINNNNYDRSVLNTSLMSGMHRKNNKSFNNNNNLEEEMCGSEILADDDDEDEVDELTLPIEVEDVERKFNGRHETPSESEGSICSFIERPGSSADIINLNDDGKGIHRNRMSLKNPKTGIHFSSHLQSEKSLFSDKNLSSSLTNSSMSLNSWNRRPSFNASLYGSTSALSDSRLLNVKSPFYDGQTIYGGASTYAKNISRMQKALRVPVQIRPVSSLSTSSSSNTSNNNPVLSNTAKRILDLMNQFNVSSPLNDAKKMGNTLNSRVPPLSLARHNHIVEDELNLNRSIRLNSAKSPYTRPDNKITRPVNKSLTTELQIPSVSQLLQIKRLQNKTEELRQLANDSKSILNTNKTTEYKLPVNDNKDSSDLLNNHSNKHTNKIKNKISATRPDKKQTTDDEPLTPVNLPNISFPAMKSVPQFDISLPISTSDPSRPSENNLATNITSKINSKATATPKLGNDSSPSNLLRSENFKFEFSSSKRPLISTPLSNNVHKKPIATNAEFSFSEPIQVLETDKVSVEYTPNKMDIKFEFRKPIPITKNSCSASGDENTVNTALSTNNKVISTPLTIPTFKFNENLDKNKSNNSVSFTVPKSKDSSRQSIGALSSEISKPSVELKSGSVMDVLMKFKNEKVKADETKNENPVTPIKEVKSLTDIFKPKTGTWECDACMIRNDSSLAKCLACESPKPGAPNNVSSSNSSLLNTFKSPDVPVKDDLFKKLVEKQNEKWECSTCGTRNESSRNKCICCEQAKPGAETNEPKFSFGSVEPKFSFGIPPISTPSTTTTLASPTTSATSSFTFGITPTTTLSTAITPTFTFGNGAITTSAETVKPVLPAVIPSGFTFGVPKTTDKVDAPKSVSMDDKTEETKLKTTVTSIFGNPTSTTTASLASTTVTKMVQAPTVTDSKSSMSDTSKKNVTTGNFIFGIPKAEEPTTSETNTAPANSSSSGGFKFTPPNNSSPSSSIVSTNIENKSLITPSLAVTPTTAVTTATVQQVTPTFGQTSGFSLFKKPENTPPQAITPLATKPETKPSVPTFGSLSQVNKIESSSTPQISTEAKPVTNSLVFGTPVNSTVTKTDNIFGSNTINPAPPVTTSAPTFGSPSGFGFSAVTTANTSITSPFSGFGSNTSTPTIGFGTKLNQPSTIKFGSFGGGGTSTNQTPASTNNTNTHNVTPVFGSFGATESPSALDSTNNTPFGQSAKLFGVTSGAAETTATSGFGSTSGNIFGQNTSSAAFGSQITSTNFGIQSVNPPPSFGATQTSFNPPQQQNDSASAPKNVFQFGGAQQSNEQPPPSNNLFQFGAANNNNNSNQPATFNFSTTAPNFNFTAIAPTTNSTQPFTFGGTDPQQPAASGGFNFSASSTEVASNSPFQFGATAGPSTSNPFAASPAGLPRKKVKPARRLR